MLEDLHKRHVVTKRTYSKDGSGRGGIPFGRGALSYLLKNRAYVGEIVHKGKYFPGGYTLIIETSTKAFLPACRKRSNAVRCRFSSTAAIRKWEQVITRI